MNENSQELFILGIPVDTPIGKCHFLKMKDYNDYAAYLNLIKMSKNEIVYRYSQLNKNGELNELIEEMKKLPLFDIVNQLPNFNEAYSEVFQKVFQNEGIFELIDRDNFISIRKLIIEMHCLKEEKISPNPEVQRRIEQSKRLKRQEQELLEVYDMISSIMAFTGVPYKEIAEMTMYQMYMTFYRIDRIKDYDTSILFATVSPEAGKNIKHWSEHVDLFEEESHALTDEQVKNLKRLFQG
ncbi:hypothetical protein OZL92_16750 [Bacillus sonorensis]|uniref:Uncharacterized protein n=2 Tax=Bacillus sonorensis TaxID=119858 RepID=M5PC14_9BACI|nr:MULTISPECIES: hypothetical protein [Bacillus]ASB89384.1 SPBc2 prophage-derived uncharacterized protein YomV [Bacillus sonorensis]EME72502.1 hypothetical protein BSONL12_21389 [Bacillus sonorensis L12]MCY7858887.1 hypothetical protein [Bacillus sonorensis]MCZ0075279.1 hypothetical protein [Bacillus sonorensis]MCZ0092993.1 hypothetical protein [Bacillus sonorensis]